ncbi:MAG: metalloregulator ArsR/SmtB family transcription factor [Alphaproteobacteria bacterium]
MDQLLSGLKAAAEVTRLRLVALLARAELTVTEVTQILGQSQPRVSRHLKLMVEAGLVERYQEGTWAFYRLADRGPGAALAAGLKQLIPHDDLTISRDFARLDSVLAERATQAQDYFAAHAAEWDELRQLHVSDETVERVMLDALKDFGGDERVGDLLDIGTGTGRIVEIFAPYFDRGIGIDLSADMLAVARVNLEKAGIDNVQIRRGDLYALPFADDSFDVVSVHQVLHFLDNMPAALGEAARVLRPGGVMLIADFAPHQLEFLRTEHNHRRLGFTDDEVSEAMKQVGLMPRAPQKMRAPKQNNADSLTVTLWQGIRDDEQLADRTSHNKTDAV